MSMGAKSKPRCGSLGFYPRKRAKRIYPTVKTFAPGDGVLGFACYKAGMVHVIALDTYERSPSYGQKIAMAATVLECPPIFVFGIRAYKKTHAGLKSFSDVFTKPKKELGRKMILPKKYETEEQIKKIEGALADVAEIRALVHTQPRFKKKPEAMEVEIGGKTIEEKWKYAKEILGKEIKTGDLIKEGDYVDVTAITKGKGTAGPVKRFGIKMQVRKAKKHRRHPGAVGAWTPSRVLWTVPMAGQLGFQRRTELNKLVLKIGGDNVTPASGFKQYGVVGSDFMLIKGSIPGVRKRLIIVRKAIRGGKKAPLPEIKEVVVE